MDRTDLDLLSELEQGLPLVNEPFQEVGKRLNLTGKEVMERIKNFMTEELSGNSRHGSTRGGWNIG